jgi:hypothetical protein
MTQRRKDGVALIAKEIKENCRPVFELETNKSR